MSIAKKSRQEVPDEKKEFDEFVYIISHDFSKPLRHVKQLCHLLFANMKEDLSEQQRLYLQAIEKAIGEGEGMLDGLLEFSRVNTRQSPPGNVNCNNLMLQVQRGLSLVFEETNPSVEYDNLPNIWADEAQVFQLFTHLISNAIKFRKADTRPEIHISAEVQGYMCEFTITDQGIGVDEGCEERIFLPFKTLHPSGCYTGTGMGLAVAKKIVQRHGGSIRCESNLGEYTRFIFTLPVSADA